MRLQSVLRTLAEECVFDASTMALRLLCVCRVWVASGTSPTVDAILAEEKCSAGTA